jgi:hypothetical protein
LNTSPTSFSLQNARSRTMQTWRLESTGLSCDEEALLSFSDITEVNLLIVSGSRYSTPHFACRIYCKDGRKLFFRADFGNLVQMVEYRAFVLGLHAALPLEPGRIRFTTGMRSKLGYGIFWWGTALAFAGLEAMVVYAVLHAGKPVAGAVFLLGTAAIAYFFLRMVKRLLAPRDYDPMAIEARLLPKG